MTAIGLVRTLLWKMITLQIRPGDLVVREFSEDQGERYWVNVVYADTGWKLPEHLCQLCKRNKCDCDGVHHRMFGKKGDGPAQRLVRLD